MKSGPPQPEPLEQQKFGKSGSGQPETENGQFLIRLLIEILGPPQLEALGQLKSGKFAPGQPKG